MGNLDEEDADAVGSSIHIPASPRFGCGRLEDRNPGPRRAGMLLTETHEAPVVDAIARVDYREPVGWELPHTRLALPLTREGGLFGRFLGGFRYDWG